MNRTTGDEIQVRRTFGGPVYRVLIIDSSEFAVRVKAVTGGCSPIALVQRKEFASVPISTQLFTVSNTVADSMGIE